MVCFTSEEPVRHLLVPKFPKCEFDALPDDVKSAPVKQ